MHFDPELAEAVVVARQALPLARAALDAVEALTAHQLEVAERRMVELAVATGVPAESLAFLTRHGLHTGLATSAQLLSDISTIRRLVQREQQAKWRQIRAEFGLLGDVRVAVNVGQAAVAIVGGLILVIGAAAGAMAGAAGKGVVAGVVAAVGDTRVKFAGKLLGGAGLGLEIVHGVLKMTTAKSSAEFASGAFSAGSGAGGVTAAAAGGGAMSAFGASLALGFYAATHAFVAAEASKIAPAFRAAGLHQRLEALREPGRQVARYATQTNWGLRAHIEAELRGLEHSHIEADWRDLKAVAQQLRAGYILAAWNLAHWLYRLFMVHRGALGTEIQNHLLAAVGGADAIPTRTTVRDLRNDTTRVTARELVRVAERALAGAEEMYYDPTVRQSISLAGPLATRARLSGR